MYPIEQTVIRKLAQMVSMINRRATGTPDVFARRVGISRTRLMQLIKQIRDTGIEVEYDRNAESYLFTQGKKYDVQCRIVEKVSQKHG